MPQHSCGGQRTILQQMGLSCDHMISGDGTIPRVGCKHLYQLSHLAETPVSFNFSKIVVPRAEDIAQ